MIHFFENTYIYFWKVRIISEKDTKVKKGFIFSISYGLVRKPHLNKFQMFYNMQLLLTDASKDFFLYENKLLFQAFFL